MKKNKNVIHIIADLGNGGAERQLVELLKANPHHKLVVLKNTGIYKKDLDKLKIDYKELNVKSTLEVLFNFHRISKIIKSSKSVIVHAWMYNACALVSLLKFLFNIRLKVVWGIRCSNMEVKHYSWNLKLVINLCKIISFAADYIVYNSYAGLKYHNSIGFSNKFNKVIYNGIDEKKFYFSNVKRNKLKKNLGIENDSIVIVCVGRVDPMKNHYNLLKAYEKVRKQNKNTRLLLIGKGTENFKEQEGVIALGMKVHIEDYYSVGDIIILPSKFGEGFSNVLAEGMLCKLFPIATKVGDSQNIISNVGLTCGGFSSLEIAKSLEIALNFTKREVINFKERARKRIILEFNIRKMSLSYNYIYNEIT